MLPDRKIAILGRCDNTRHEAPWDDPDREKWGSAPDIAFSGRRHHEIHTPRSWTNGTISDRMNYPEFLGATAESKDELWLQERYVPGAHVFPLDELRKYKYLCLPNSTEPYLESSIGWMIAHAVLERETISRLGVWGVDLTAEDEWAYQRPNMSYLIGVCRALGLPVIIPRQCALDELRALNTETFSFTDPDVPRWHLEYKLAFERVAGREPEIRSDLLTSCFNDPPRYGYCAIPITEYFEGKVA